MKETKDKSNDIAIINSKSNYSQSLPSPNLLTEVSSISSNNSLDLNQTTPLISKPKSKSKSKDNSSKYKDKHNELRIDLNGLLNYGTNNPHLNPESEYFEENENNRSPPRRDMLPSPTPSQLEDFVFDPNSIPFTNQDLPKSFIGLSDKEAYSQLIKSVEELLTHFNTEEPLSEYLYEYLIRVESLILLGLVLLLLFVFIWGYWRGTMSNTVQYQFRYTGVLVEVVILLVVLVWNGVMFYREKSIASHEIIDRTRSILRVMEDNRARPMRPLKVPFCPTFSIVNVYRDGILQQLPVHLTVDGDVVEIPLGTVAPFDMEYLGQSPDRKMLSRGQILTSDFFEFDMQVPLQQSTFRFLLCETRFTSTLVETLQQRRPRSVIECQRSKIRKYFSLGFGFSSLLLCHLVNLLVFMFVDLPNDNWDHWVEVLLRVPGYALLAWLPLWIPSLWFVVRSFCNAHTLVLFEALQKSKEEFEDDEDIDEFDTEAPSPTKNVEIALKAVLEKWWWLMSQWNQISLTRSTNLFESLGSITMICALDKEETIATPFPELEQILFVNGQEETVVLDVNEDHSVPNGIVFEDRYWLKYLDCLKPLGFNMILCSKCGFLDDTKVTYKPNDSHLNNLDLDISEACTQVRQTCFCRLGKEVGYSADALKRLNRLKDVVVMAPYHPSLNNPTFSKLDFEVPTLFNTYYSDPTQSGYQISSTGHLELVLDACTEFWDGEGLCNLTENVETKLYEFYQNAVLNDLQCTAFAYRPVVVKQDMDLPLLSDGDTKSSVKIRVPKLDDQLLRSPKSVTLSTISTSINEEEDNKFRRKRMFRRDSNDLANSTEVDPTVVNLDPNSFFKDMAKGQIFLGMATAANQPKRDVCDFIEDLKLAGIRFAYLSPKGERRSKAFAERLGLETDWNTCIRLSSFGTDEDLDDHYIKARLPRGIETIRHHLENVDDIPLQVSLFAECLPEASLELVKIFQEYGEVVCCVGNSLNHVNTPAFATADLGIAVEPLLHRQFAAKQLFHSTVSLGSALTSLPCALSLNKETSLFVLTQIIREARRLLNSVRQGGSFLLVVGMACSLLVILNSALLQPPILSGYQIMWLQWIIGPILALPFLFTQHEPGTMTTFVGKNKDPILGFSRFFAYGLARTLISILTWQYLFLTTFRQFRQLAGDANEPLLSRRNDWFEWNLKEQWALLHAQNLTLLLCVIHLAALSSTFLSRTLYVWQFNPIDNRYWLVGVTFAILLQLCYTATFFLVSPEPFTLAEVIGCLPTSFYYVGLGSLLLVLPIQELVKYHDLDLYTRFQKRSKLEFNTKLGLHSPV